MKKVGIPQTLTPDFLAPLKLTARFSAKLIFSYSEAPIPVRLNPDNSCLGFFHESVKNALSYNLIAFCIFTEQLNSFCSD